MKKSHIAPVTVEWVDSCGSVSHWRFPEDLDHSPDRILSRGYLIHKDKHTITIALSLASHGACGAPMTIPRCAVTKLTYDEVAK